MKHNKKRLKIIVSGFLLLTGTLSFLYFLQTGTTSPFVKEIQAYENKNNDASNLNLTSIAENYVVIGMDKKEVLSFFEKMNFEVHESWQEKNLYVADYRSNIGAKIFHLVKNYRFLLFFEDEKLKKIEGKSYVEAP